MNLSEIFTTENVGICAAAVIALMSIVQISPIQINPWSWLARKCGNALNHDLKTSIDELSDRVTDVESSVQEIKKNIDENNAITARVRILNFNEELLREQRHSKEAFDQALENVTNYNHYCDTHPDFANDKAVMAIQNIRKCYQKCMDDHDFL